MRSVVGREFGTARRSVPISLSDIRKWALAIYYPEVPPRLFWDEDYAASTSHGGIVAPEEFNPFAWFTADGPVMPSNYEGEIRGSGPEEPLGVAEPETSFILNGGLELVHGARMRPGDVITSGSHEARRIPGTPDPARPHADHDHRDDVDESEGRDGESDPRHRAAVLSGRSPGSDDRRDRAGNSDVRARGGVPRVEPICGGERGVRPHSHG